MRAVRLRNVGIAKHFDRAFQIMRPGRGRKEGSDLDQLVTIKSARIGARHRFEHGGRALAVDLRAQGSHPLHIAIEDGLERRVGPIAGRPQHAVAHLRHQIVRELVQHRLPAVRRESDGDDLARQAEICGVW